MQGQQDLQSTCSSASHRSDSSSTRGLENRLASLQAVLAQLAEGYILTDLDGRIVEANTAAAAAFDVDASELSGTHLSQYLAEEAHAAFRDVVSALHAEPPPDTQSLEVPLRARNGLQILALLHAMPEQGHDGAPRCIHWLITPVPPLAEQTARHAWSGVEQLASAEQRAGYLVGTRAHLVSETRSLAGAMQKLVADPHWQAAETLGARTGFLEHLTQSAQIGIAVVSAPDYRYAYVNPYLASLPGLAGQQMIGQHVGNALPPQAAKDIIAVLERARTTHKALHVHEYEGFLIPTGPPTYWDVEVLPLTGTGDGGEDVVEHLVVLAHDITALVRARRRAAELAARNEAILNSLREGVIVCDLKGTIISINPAALHHLGIAGEGALPHSLMELSATFRMYDLSGRALPLNEWPLSRLLREGQTLSDLILRVVRTDTDHEWIGNYNGSLVRDAAGNPALAVLTIRDVTERVRDEQERRKLMIGLSKARHHAERAAARARRRAEEREELVAALSDEQTRLETERARLRAILDALPVGVFVVDAEGRIVETNDRVADIIGGMPPITLGDDKVSLVKGWWLDTGEPLAADDWAVARALRDGTTTTGEEIEILRFDGSRGYILHAAAPIIDSDGHRIGAVVIMQDITELRETRERLVRFASRLEALRDMDRAVLEAVTIEEMADSALPWLCDALDCWLVSIILLDADAQTLTAYTLVTSRAEDERHVPAPGMHACRQQQMPLGAAHHLQALRETVVVEDIDATPASDTSLGPLYTLVRDTGIRAFTAVPMTARDGLLGTLVIGLEQPGHLDDEQMAVAGEVADELAVAVRQSQLREEVRRHSAMLEQTVAERTAELRASEARFRAIFEGTAVGIVVTGLQGTIVQANPAIQEMVGYKAEELIGQSYTLLVHPDSLKREAPMLQRLVQGEIDDYRTEKQLVRRDGKIVWIRLTVSLVRDAGGAPSFVIGMAEDITARKEAEEALIRAEKLTLTGQLAASLAHEIGNPLQSIVGCLNLTQEKLRDSGGVPDEVPQLLTMALGEAKRAAGIVRELRDISRPAPPEERTPTDLVDLLTTVLGLVEPQAEAQGVTLQFHPPASARPTLNVVTNRLHQVFLNFALNAVEAMPEGGHLDVHLDPTTDPEGVTITFRDTGSGMSEDIRAHIFEPFYTTKGKGLGLGLYISHRIVQDHGGTLDVDSTPGTGTTLTLWLPALPPTPSSTIQTDL